MVGMAGDGVGGFMDALSIQLLKRFAQLGDGGELFMMDGSRGIFYSAREEVERMDNAISFGD